MLDVLEDALGDLVAVGASQWKQHRLAERAGQQGLDVVEMLAGKRGETDRVGIEAKDGAEFQQEPKVEISEVALQGIQRQDAFLQPIHQPVLVRLVLYNTEKHLAHKKRHRVLMNIPADPHERIDTDEIAGEPEIRLRVLRDLRLKNIQGQEKGHRGLGTHLHKEAPPSIFPTDCVQDDGILTYFGVAEDDEFSLRAH